MDYWYYIVENKCASDPTVKGLDTQILKVPQYLPYQKLSKGDGPYASLRALKRRSIIFQQLKRKSSKLVERLLNEKNILDVQGYILTSDDKTYPGELLDLFDHIVRPQIKNGTANGIHFYNPKFTRIIQMVKQENEFGVWEAIVDILDERTNQWIRKDKPSTFFPKHWSIGQLFLECGYAYEHKEKFENGDSVYVAKTISGIDVEIIIVDNVVKTIYPLMNDPG